MKLQNVILCNFRNFRGEHKIDMTSHSDDKQNNIILIGGFNGSGKTTIVDSIKLCMFGRRFNSFTLSSQNYYNYLFLAKNKSSVKDNDNRFFIQIELEIDDTYPTYSITLKRDWEFKDGRVDKENFTIYRDGVPLEIIPRDYWEDYIISLIPPYVSNYFFFDGERVKKLACGNKAEEILKESIRDLIGLKLYETLANDLDTLERKIKRRNINQPDLQEKIKEKEKEVSEVKKNINKIEKNIEDKYSKIKELNVEKIDIENDLRRKAGAFAEERKKNEKEILRLKGELTELNDEIKKICGDVLPFVIASDTCRNLLDKLKEEKRQKELIANAHVLKKTNQVFMEKIDSSTALIKFSKKDLKIIKSEIDNIFSKMFEDINNRSKKLFVHDLTNAEIGRIENFLKKTEENVNTKLDKTLKLREKNLIQIKKFREKLKNIPDEIFVKDYIDKLSTIQTKLDVLEKDINSLKEEKLLSWEKKAEIEDVIKKLEEKIVCDEEDYRKIEICKKIRKSTQEFIDIIISSKTKELGKIITTMYRNLANKKDMVKEIKIAPDTFSTTLIDFDGGIVNKDIISAGEKEIYALSVLWGLAKISNKKLPIIIDSPLAKLDNSHVNKIIENFFPNAGNQVIILSHDRELDINSYRRLKPYLNRVYRLTMDQENKIIKGYFFD